MEEITLTNPEENNLAPAIKENGRDLTTKQKKFIEGKSKGMSDADACRFAGYGKNVTRNPQIVKRSVRKYLQAQDPEILKADKETIARTIGLTTNLILEEVLAMIKNTTGMHKLRALELASKIMGTFAPEKSEVKSELIKPTEQEVDTKINDILAYMDRHNQS